MIGLNEKLFWKDWIEFYTQNLKSTEEKFNSSLLDTFLEKSVKVKRFSDAKEFNKIKALQNKALLDCIYLCGNFFLFYVYKNRKFSFKLKSFDFHSKSKNNKCKPETPF